MISIFRGVEEVNTNIIAGIATIVFFLLFVAFGIPIIIVSYLVQGVKEGILFFEEIMTEFLRS